MALSERTGTSTTPPRSECVDVLVVDDNATVRASFAEIAASAGYSVATAEDGIFALEVLATSSVGVIVLDVRMPRLDGIGLLEAIDDGPPVVLLTCVPIQVLAGVRSNVQRYLQKPVDPGRFLDAIEHAIGLPAPFSIDGGGP